MTTRNKIIWSGILLAIAALIIARVIFSGGSGDVKTVLVERGDVTEYVSETGKVVAVDDIDLFFETTGRVDAVLVKEGDAVEEGDAIMRLDAGQLHIRRRDAVAALKTVQAQYDKALAGATPEEIRIKEIAVDNAEDSLMSARQTLDDTIASNDIALDKAYSDLIGDVESVYLKSSTAMQIMENNVFNAAGNLRYDIIPSDTVSASEATAAFQVALSAKDRMNDNIVAIRTVSGGDVIEALAAALIADGKAIRDAAAKANQLMQDAVPTAGLSQTTFDTRATSVKTAWTDVNTAVNTAESQKALISTTKISKLSSENTARQKVTTAEGALRTAQEQLADLKAPLRDVDKAVYLAQIASARANISLYDKQISDTILTAPVTGIIGSLDVSVGEIATPSVRAASVISKAFRIESDVSELDIDKISEGQEVAITFDALPGRTFMGKVATVAPRETTSADSDIFYTVKIGIDDSEATLRSGMTADLDINVGEVTDAIVVPRRQVLRRDGSNFVKVLNDDGKSEERDVVVGLRGDERYEIVQGLREGERVLIE